MLLLDELTTFLDVEDQFGVLGAVRDITRARADVTAIWVTHRWAGMLHVRVSDVCVSWQMHLKERCLCVYDVKHGRTRRVDVNRCTGCACRAI